MPRVEKLKRKQTVLLFTRHRTLAEPKAKCFIKVMLSYPDTVKGDFLKHISKENKIISNAFIWIVKIAPMVLKMCAMCNDLSFDEGYSQMANISHCAKNS